MIDRKLPGSDLTSAQRLAQDAFKIEVKAPSEAEIAKTAFDENRARLKSERIARETAAIDAGPKK